VAIQPLQTKHAILRAPKRRGHAPERKRQIRRQRVTEAVLDLIPGIRSQNQRLGFTGFIGKTRQRAFLGGALGTAPGAARRLTPFAPEYGTTSGEERQWGYVRIYADTPVG
jgi:hypothetical protein